MKSVLLSLLLIFGVAGCQPLTVENMTTRSPTPTNAIIQLSATHSVTCTQSVIATPTIQPANVLPVVSVSSPTSTLTSTPISPSSIMSGMLVVIAYQANKQAESSHLVLIDLPEGNRIFLTEGSGQDQQPKWSPDGQYIAFSSNRNGRFDIFLVHRDGTGLIQLTYGPSDKYSPTWSPDGKRLAFVSQQRQDGGNTAIHIIDLETRQVTNLHQVDWSIGGPAIQNVDWSPVNENLLLYTLDERLAVQQSDTEMNGYHDGQVYLYDMRNSQSTLLIPEGWACSESHWSSDGVSILMNFCINYTGIPDTSFAKEGILLETESGFVLKNIYTLYDMSGCNVSWSLAACRRTWMRGNPQLVGAVFAHQMGVPEQVRGSGVPQWGIWSSLRQTARWKNVGGNL